MNIPPIVSDIGSKIMSRGHKLILTVTGGRVLNTAFDMPVIELHTTGRRSGAKRSTMLTSPVQDGDTIVLVASKGGDDRHPHWYLNLDANPDVDLTIDGDTKPYVAHTASAAEKAELWPQITGKYKGYAGYQANTDREIPVVICQPR